MPAQLQDEFIVAVVLEDSGRNRKYKYLLNHHNFLVVSNIYTYQTLTYLLFSTRSYKLVVSHWIASVVYMIFLDTERNVIFSIILF